MNMVYLSKYTVLHYHTQATPSAGAGLQQALHIERPYTASNPYPAPHTQHLHLPSRAACKTLATEPMPEQPWLCGTCQVEI